MKYDVTMQLNIELKKVLKNLSLFLYILQTRNLKYPVRSDHVAQFFIIRSPSLPHQNKKYVKIRELKIFAFSQKNNRYIKFYILNIINIGKKVSCPNEWK